MGTRSPSKTVRDVWLFGGIEFIECFWVTMVLAILGIVFDWPYCLLLVSPNTTRTTEIPRPVTLHFYPWNILWWDGMWTKRPVGWSHWLHLHLLLYWTMPSAGHEAQKVDIKGIRDIRAKYRLLSCSRLETRNSARLTDQRGSDVFSCNPSMSVIFCLLPR